MLPAPSPIFCIVLTFGDAERCISRLTRRTGKEVFVITYFALIAGILRYDFESFWRTQNILALLQKARHDRAGILTPEQIPIRASVVRREVIARL